MFQNLRLTDEELIAVLIEASESQLNGLAEAIAFVALSGIPMSDLKYFSRRNVMQYFRLDHHSPISVVNKVMSKSVDARLLLQDMIRKGPNNFPLDRHVSIHREYTAILHRLNLIDRIQERQQHEAAERCILSPAVINGVIDYCVYVTDKRTKDSFVNDLLGQLSDLFSEASHVFRPEKARTV